MNRIELLAPAKDLECGKAAVDNGADAVYIGASRFGARENAGNPIADIATLTEYAHRYWVKVYATVNTLLFDEEIPQAVRLIEQLYEIGVNGLIVQDMGLLECDLPPLPLIASTQMHNDTPEKAAFLQGVGFQRMILARELSLDRIAAIRQAAPQIELECFIHGALCVCYSGQCAMSYALGGRSANRGQCAQPCRKSYTLLDGQGNSTGGERHWLSIRDLNLTDSLRQLIEAGVCSFKIEGRLKDRAYIANVTAHYRKRLDALLPEMGLRKTSSGTCRFDFEPNPDKTFNRGFTTYFLHGGNPRVGSIDTPKMMGERIGRVITVCDGEITVDSAITLHPGDGLCFLDKNRRLCGTPLNAVRGRALVPDKVVGIEKGTVLYRNRDHEFLTRLQKNRTQREIAVSFSLKETDGGLLLTLIDEDGVTAEHSLPGPLEPARKPEGALETIHRQLTKCGGSEFVCRDINLDLNRPPFLPISALNEFRREALGKLHTAREKSRPTRKGGAIRNNLPYPAAELSFLGNVLNRFAEAFYRRHGVTVVEPAAESGLFMPGRKVMTTRYCIQRQLDRCPKMGNASPDSKPCFLVDEEGRRFELRFRCDRCEMDVIFAGNNANPA